jgi:polyketide biosynthesis acyl carrier protein
MDKETILLVIKKHIMALLPDVREIDIKMGVKMADLGANSIDRAEVVVAVMEELNIKVPLVCFGKAKNITDLTDILFQAVNNEHSK